jgi:hypothetical protein
MVSVRLKIVPILILVTVAIIQITGIQKVWAATNICPLPPENLRFTIFNNEDDVGALDLVFADKGNRRTLDISMQIKVRILFVTAYRFRHNATETWSAAGLNSLSSETNDNGREYVVSIKPEGTGHQVRSNEGNVLTTGTRLTELIWCEKSARGGKVISTLTGSVDDIPIDYIGPETISIDGHDHTARHYRFVRKKRTGHFWYDKNGVLLKLTYPTRYFTVARFERRTN